MSAAGIPKSAGEMVHAQAADGTTLPAGPGMPALAPAELADRSREAKRIRTSKALSTILRHRAVEYGLAIRDDGYAPLAAVLRLRQLSGISEAEVRAIVAACPKQRFSLAEDAATCELLIRANQGHSLRGVLRDEALLERVAAAEVRECSQARWREG
jgi:RNA:NAD 2'-phosphotransferase (TPT1/KptA family)